MGFRLDSTPPAPPAQTGEGQNGGDGFIRPETGTMGQPNQSPPSSPAQMQQDAPPPVPPEQEPAIKNDQSDEWAKKFAMLAQTERRMLQMQQELQARESKWKDMEPKFQEWQEIQKLKEKDPLGWLEKEGLPYDQLSEQIVNNEEYQKGAEYRQLMRRMEKMEEAFQERINELSQFKEQTTKKEQDQQIAEYHKQVKDFVGQKTDDYELINALGDTNVILQMQGEYYKKYGQLADLDQLCKQYEKHLESEVLDKQLNKVQQLKKYQARMGQNQAKDEPPMTQNPQNPFAHKREPSTLNNALSSDVPPQKRPTTSDERRKRALEAYLANRTI